MLHGEAIQTEEIARWFFQQLVLAVDYCHKKNVINRDIKVWVHPWFCVIWLRPVSDWSGLRAR